jgi:hypothetical protein
VTIFASQAWLRQTQACPASAMVSGGTAIPQTPHYCGTSSAGPSQKNVTRPSINLEVLQRMNYHGTLTTHTPLDRRCGSIPAEYNRVSELQDETPRGPTSVMCQTTITPRTTCAGLNLEANRTVSWATSYARTHVCMPSTLHLHIHTWHCI